jgi:hypothetical protein
MSRMNLDPRVGVEVTGRGGRDERLGLFDVGFAEEELAVQVGEVDGV